MRCRHQLQTCMIESQCPSCSRLMVFEIPSIKLRGASAITLIIFSHELLAACIILTTCVYGELLNTCAKEPNSLTLLLASKRLGCQAGQTIGN